MIGEQEVSNRAHCRLVVVHWLLLMWCRRYVITVYAAITMLGRDDMINMMNRLILGLKEVLILLICMFDAYQKDDKTPED